MKADIRPLVDAIRAVANVQLGEPLSHRAKSVRSEIIRSMIRRRWVLVESVSDVQIAPVRYDLIVDIERACSTTDEVRAYMKNEDERWDDRCRQCDGHGCRHCLE